jgi:hypothetical protein
MKYMLLIYQNPDGMQALTEDERQAVMADAGELMGELEKSGEWVGGEALAAPASSKGVRVRGGVPAVTDGPYLEAKEQLAGYCIVDCASIDRAVQIAARWPDARYWGMEVRPLVS